MPPEEFRYALLRAIRMNPDTNQRALSELLGVSVGRINAGLRKLIDQGLVYATDAGAGRRQRYEVSDLGTAEQTALATVFIQRKAQQREELKNEIRQLEADLAKHASRANARLE